MDTALPQKFPFILDRNLAKANCTGNRVCTSCDTVVLALSLISYMSCGNRSVSVWGGCIVEAQRYYLLGFVQLELRTAIPVEKQYE